MTKPHRAGRKGHPSAAPAVATQPPRRLWWCAAIIVAAGILTYANSLSGAFILDDQSTIVDNQQIREWWRPSSVLSPEPNTAIAGRPVVNLTFAVNYALGGLNVRGYHAVNIAIHIVCALLAFGVLRRTLELPRLRDRFGTSAVWLSCAVGVLWAVHPLNSEVVNYLTERTESLMALFFLLTLYASIRALDADGPETSRSQARKPPRTTGKWRVLAIVACGVGMACKESMVTAPVLVLLYDRTFVFETFRDAFGRRRGLYIGLAATWLVLAALMLSGPRSAVGGFSTGISPWSYLLNQTQMISHYLWLSFWPRSLVVFYGWPAALTLRDVLPYALFISLLLLATIAALVRVPAAGFLGAWFFITLAPTSSVVPIATEVGAERRMYLPLLAVVTLVVVGLFAAWQQWIIGRLSGPHGLNFRLVRTARVAAPVVLALAALSLALGTVTRNREYSSALTIARTVVERRPSAVTHHYLAEQLAQAGLHDEARQHLHDAVAGGDSRARYLLGIELFNAGKLNESMEQLYAFVATAKLPYRLVPHWLEPPAAEVVTARLVLARTAAMQGAWSRSAEQARLVLAVAPGNRDARMFLADSLFAQQQYEQAGAEYARYLELDAASTHALVNLGITLVAAGKIDEALPKFRRAVEVEPRNVNARRVLATALLDAGDVQGAEVQAREAVALSPKDPALNELLARASAAARTGGRQ